MNDFKNNTVKSNLATIVKTNTIKINEIRFRNVSPEVKLNELRTVQTYLEGVISVIEHTGSYVQEMSALLSLSRQLYNSMNDYLE